MLSHTVHLPQTRDPLASPAAAADEHDGEGDGYMTRAAAAAEAAVCCSWSRSCADCRAGVRGSAVAASLVTSFPKEMPAHDAEAGAPSGAFSANVFTHASPFNRSIMSQSVQCFGKKKNAVRLNLRLNPFFLRDRRLFPHSPIADNCAGGCQPLQEGQGHHQGQRQAFVSG
jgi:hypothetical protein